MSSTAGPLTPASCAKQAAALLTEAVQLQVTDEVAARMVHIADGWRQLGETIATNPTMCVTADQMARSALLASDTE